MEGVHCCTMLYIPISHGDLYLLYNVVWPHGPWGFVTIAAPMTHGEKVAEGAQRTWYRHNPGRKKAGYGSLMAKETQAIERINAIPNDPCPQSKAQKQHHLEIEEVEVTPHPSKRATGSGSVSAPTLHICTSKV